MRSRRARNSTRRRRPARTIRRVRAPWRRLVPAFITLLILLLAPILAYAQGAGPDSVALSWTAPGDDSLVGTAAAYDIRISTAPIDAPGWTSANAIAGLPAPHASGTHERFVVHGLSRDTTYYFAIRTRDDAGNWSGVSNLVRWDWQYDTAPPAAPQGLTASRTGKTVNLHWNPNAEPDLMGYSVYRAQSSTGPWSLVTASLVSGTNWADNTVPAGTKNLWYQLTASDDSGNESGRSAALPVSLVSNRATIATLGAAYPNPSTGTATVRIPIEVPDTGPADAIIVFLNASGMLVRRIDLAGLAPGSQEVSWDGRNDAGRLVAPGVYHARLIVGSSRSDVRLLRLP